ncbi:unnamed protein product [Ectocarpus sp. CCAP 1310/34]|nr:unnamed protein product [Ectocarpus sp. CCAP 1310/34]
MGSPSRNNDPNWTPQLSAFTSGDAHNGCRALFNGTEGWAYFGPAGEIDEGALPAGTVSYPYKSGMFGMTASGSGSGRDGGGTSQAAKKPGDDLSRKSNEMRGVYFDAKDLAHLVRGWAGDDDDGDDDDDDAVQYGGGCCERGGGGKEEEGRPRKGRPIVLTLQAILAATTPTAAAAVVAADAVAAFPLNTNAAAAAAAAAEEETATDKESNNYTGAAAAIPAAAAAVAGVTAADTNAQFPPLVLRDASAEKGPGLYLAPPITMVKKNSPGHPAEQLATSHEAAAAGTQGCAVSCSEAAAATSVAEAAVLAAAAAAADETAADGAAAAAATIGGGSGAVSRIGWWLRWATSGSGEGQVSPAAEAARGDGLETRSGADGWEVVVSSAPAAAAGVAANASDGAVHERRGGGGGGGGKDDVASWSDFAGEEDKADTRFGKDGGDDDATAAAPQSVSPNVPRSFRDTLMAGGAAGFSDPKAFSRSRAAAAASLSSSGAASSPTLVDGGEQGGAVFLWRKAAAGQGGRAADRAKSMLEDEDPYYARKRVGAFAHRTKPRGKAHK